MTLSLAGPEVAAGIEAAFPGAVIETAPDAVTVDAARVVEIATFVRDDANLDAKYLNSLTALDWIDYYEVVYHLSSLAKNHTFVLKARANHDTPAVPSVINVWQGADLQEREVFDLMGVSFIGHPSQKRIFLWEGFPGHPLRKDFLALPGGFKPGLNRFPYEFNSGGPTGYGTVTPPATEEEVLPDIEETPTGESEAH
jgi:NADH-quinone oxidoreductase subunit C